MGQGGDADLSAIVGITTNDAAVLQFDFQFGDGSGGGDLFFNYLFASEEYIDFVNSAFNDVFALILDGINLAVLPGGAGPVTINNVNPTSNSAFYVNNVSNTNGFPVAGADTMYDGFTTVLQAQALGLAAGPHSIKFAVADTTDSILDAAVFIQAGTFGQTQTPTGVPVPGTLALLGAGLIAGFAFSARVRRADRHSRYSAS